MIDKVERRYVAMKTSWPRVEASVQRIFSADHSLPGVGVAEVHRHHYWADCGYHHEINPQTGCSRPMQEMQKEVNEVIDRLAGKSLNEVLPVPPTAEMMACWILANLEHYWDFVRIRAYGGFECRIDRRYITTAWLEKLRARPA